MATALIKNANVGLPPQVLLWGVGVPWKAVQGSLEELMRDAGHWSGIDVFCEDVALDSCAGSSNSNASGADGAGTRITWHRGAGTMAEAFAATALREGVHLVWLTAGTRTPRNWTLPLERRLAEEPSLGSCSPLAVGHPRFTPFFDNTHQQIDPKALHAWLLAHAPVPALELGGALPHAGVLRHEAWRAIREVRPQDWALAVAQAGWVHGTSRQVCVRVAASMPPLKSVTPFQDLTLLGEESRWKDAHPLTGLRHATSQVPMTHWAESGGVAPPARPAVSLHVMHSWGGGLRKWVHDYATAQAINGAGRGLLLKSIGTYGAFGQRLELHTGDDGGDPLEFWELGLPIHAVAPAHLQVQQILKDVIGRYGVDRVLVSSLIGHSLDVLRTGLPTVLVLHDHHPYCVTLYAQFEGECRQCDSGRLATCMEQNPGHRFFRGVSPQDWSALRSTFVDTLIRHRPLLAAPSVSVANRWASLMPALAELRVRVIEHGLDLPQVPPFDPPEGGRLRVVVLGRLSVEKGRLLLADVVPGTAGWADILLLGCGDQEDPLKRMPNVSVVPHFDAADLPALVAAWKPHIGMLLSAVPETFSYALSELWHCGVPVLACASGAFADRIDDGADGFLVPPQATLISSRLYELHLNRGVLVDMRRRLTARASRTLQDMLHDYTDEFQRMPNRRWADRDPSSATIPWLREGSAASRRSWIRVSLEATWWQAMKGFLAYTKRKAAHSPRLPAFLRRWL
jgi:glycosyltransferase involved in cell wall biosynthesis